MKLVARLYEIEVVEASQLKKSKSRSQEAALAAAREPAWHSCLSTFPPVSARLFDISAPHKTGDISLTISSTDASKLELTQLSQRSS